MKGRIFSLMAICLTLLLTGCGNPREIALTSYQVERIGGIEFEENGVHTTVYLKVCVSNPTRCKLTLKECTATVYRENGDPFADLAVIGQPEVPKHSADTIPVALDATLKNPMALMFDGGLDIHTMKADINALVKWGSVTRTIVKTGYPLSGLLENGPVKLGNTK
jgi:hypothetical protein